MKNKAIVSFILIFAIFFINITCDSNKISNKVEIKEKTNVIEDETKSLLSFFSKTGNFINSKKIPVIIGTDDVNNNIKNYHIIDIRKKSDYVSGHINGAVLVKFDEILSYMKSINPNRYEKIVIVCYSGQKAGYATSVLRHLGYANVYSMKWGMSSWNEKTSAKWVNNISDKYSSELETSGNKMNSTDAYPVIKTEKTSNYNILKQRADDVIKDAKFIVKAEKVFSETDKYYIINYWPKKFYDIGHIKGAVQYTPKKSLTSDTFLKTLPSDKPILVYCFTGQHAAYVVAYLRILGYDAYSLAYGANSFMHKKMKSEIGHDFDASSHIKNYELVEGELPSIKTANTPKVDNSQNDKPKTTINIPKKKIEEEEGGC